MAHELAKQENSAYTVELLKEGEETDQFWTALGGKKKYDRDADFINHTRLFRCTNEKGFFSVSEKTVDFCQVINFELKTYYQRNRGCDP